MSAATDRLERFRGFVALDPGNARLLADAADAAIAARAFDDADRFIADGIAAEGATAAWRFRRATLRIAEGRLTDARELLLQLRGEGVADAAVDYNLACIAWLEGDFESCANLLHGWMDRPDAPTAAATLWLRAMHHLDRLGGAWAWIEAHGVARLDASGAGVAALIALDIGKWDAARRFAGAALAKHPAQPEALLVQGSLLLGQRDVTGACSVFAQVAREHPHQPRAWSLLGFGCLLQGQGSGAREHFERALALAPADEATRVGLGWACIIEGDLARATAAFSEAVAGDASSADAHGGLAVALALQERRAEASAHAQQARKLQAGHLAARYADAIVTGRSGGLRGAQRLVAQLFGAPPTRT